MSGSVTVNAGAAGSVTIPASSALNQAYLNLAIASLGAGSIIGTALSGGGTAPTVSGGIGVAVNTGGGVVSLPGTGYKLVALSGNSAATVQGGDNSLHIVSGFGGLNYAGGAQSIVASGGANNITATVGGTVGGIAQFVDVGGTSTVTADSALVQTEGGASSINAGSNNFVVYSGSDTINTGAGPNTVAAVGSVGGVTNAGDGNLLFVVGGDSQGVQTVFGGAGNETVFAGPKSMVWQGLTPGGGSLLFIGGPSASTVTGGSGNETLFGGTGGDVYNMGGGHNILVTNNGNFAVTGGAGQSDIYGNAGANITLTDDTVGARNLLVVGSGAETINALAGSGNTFIISTNNNNNATITASGLGGDEFDIYNQGSASAGGTITITNFVANSSFQTLVFIGYGFNPTNVHDGGALASNPTQTIVAGSNHITLSDNTTIVLENFNQIMNFNNFNAIV